MENTYTKGPWVTGVGFWDESTGLNPALAIFEKSEVPSEGAATAICLISPIDKVNPTDMANAKLIVAAPELLDALIELKAEVEKRCSLGSDPVMMEMLRKWQTAHKAIQKATE